MTIAVTGAVIVTVVIIGTFTIMSFFATRSLSVAGQDDLTIRVRGLQWWWGLEYIGRIRPGDSRPPTKSTFRSAATCGSSSRASTSSIRSGCRASRASRT